MVEYLVGLDVIDEAAYAKYRAVMTPLRNARRGGLGYDFRVPNLLKSESDAAINRVFTVFFQDQKTADGFFSDPIYQRAKDAFFNQAVAATPILAHYRRCLYDRG